MHKQPGFTLIELMMVMAILAILLALVIPGYQQTVRQSRRTEAVSLLTTAASLQQQFRTRVGHFTSDMTELDTSLLARDYYQLSMVIDDETPLSISTGSSSVQIDCTTAPCFKLAAVTCPDPVFAGQYRPARDKGSPFMTLRVALAQFRFPVGDIPGNTDKVLDLARQAQADGADLIVFPELTLAGYPPEDLLLRPSLELRIGEAIERLKAAELDIAMVVGYPEREAGKLYNKAMVVQHGRVIADYRKQHLPNYQVFDEKRYFTKANETCVFEFKGAKIALTICEDMSGGWRVRPI